MTADQTPSPLDESFDEGGQALVRHATELDTYLNDQKALIGSDARLVEMPGHPYPDPSNPEAQFLMDRAMEMYEESGDVVQAILWVTTHAWRGGAIHEMARAAAE